MNWLWFSPLVFLGIANVVIAGIVSARDFRKLNNRAFAGFALAIGVWVVGIVGFLLSHDRSIALNWARIYYEAPLLIAVSGYFFAGTFPSREKVNTKLACVLIGGFIVLSSILLFFPSVFATGLRYHSWGKEVLLNQLTYTFYTVYVIFFFAVILWVMRLKAHRLNGVYALQANLFFQTLSVTAAFGLLFNLILPFFHDYRLIGLGPLFTSISVTGIGYSIVRHRMFDIRAVIARSLSYTLSLVVVSGVYGFVIFGIAEVIFKVHFSALEQIFLSLGTGLASLFFSRFRKTFDRFTNRFFYQDAYDPQELFDRLNKILVSTSDLNRLMKQSSEVLAEILKAEFCFIAIRESESQDVRIIGTQKPHFQSDDILFARHATPYLHHAIIETDYLEEGDAELKAVLDRYRIAVLIRLTQHVTRVEEGLGYIVLGIKKSGNPYSVKDYRVLDTVAKELIIAIQNALRFEEIQNFNLTLQAKVDEATRKMRRANERLRTLDETKDDFISMASHQLRTPLTSVKGYVSMVMEGDTGKLNKLQQEMLGQAFFSSQRMVYLIADLLNVSRLKTGKFIIDSHPVNLARIVDEEVSQLTETAKAHNLTLTYDQPKDYPELMFDETKIRQVIMNFADNAIYYTPAGGHVNIRLVDTPTTIELRVEDDGIGVPRAERPHLFSKFYRAGNARKARPDGTGLGLFMAKKVVSAQGGSLIFESEENKGSTFGFAFSKSKLAVPESQKKHDLK